MVRILFSMNRNLSVFCANTMVMVCARCLLMFTSGLWKINYHMPSANCSQTIWFACVYQPLFGHLDYSSRCLNSLFEHQRLCQIVQTMPDCGTVYFGVQIINLVSQIGFPDIQIFCLVDVCLDLAWTVYRYLGRLFNYLDSICLVLVQTMCGWLPRHPACQNTRLV